MLFPLALVAGSLAAAAVPPDAGERAVLLARELVALGPRHAPGEVEAAKRWTAERLEERGWSPTAIPVDAVLACRRGERPETLLLLAHVDAVHPEVPGANDNAAAIGALLVAAGALPERPLRSVCLGFPGGEELGLLGSRQLARWLLDEGNGAALPGPLDQVVSIDLVGRGRLTHNGLGPAWGRNRIAVLLGAVPAEVPLVYRALSHGVPAMERSDHAPFAWRGVPASHLMARGEGGIDAGYHTREDRPERLQAGTLQQVVEGVVALAAVGPLPEDREAEWAVVLPLAGWVAPGGAVAGVMLAGALAGLTGLLGAVPWRTELRGWGVALAGAVVAGLGAAGAIALAAAGRPVDMALAGPAIAAGAASWALLGWLWPWRASEASGRRLALVAVGASAVGAGTVAPLLLLPLAVMAGAIAVARGRLRWPLLPVVGWAPLYMLRPDALRELAFHGMYPAGALSWAAAFLVLTLPVWGVLQGRAMPRGPVRVAVAALLAAGLVAALLLAWTTDPGEAPFPRWERLPPGR